MLEEHPQAFAFGGFIERDLGCKKQLVFLEVFSVCDVVRASDRYDDRGGVSALARALLRHAPGDGLVVRVGARVDEALAFLGGRGGRESTGLAEESA